MENCLFCKIVAGEVPSVNVYEDENILAFLDINPVNPGHTLVISKQHYPNVYETPDSVLQKLISVVKKVAVAVKKGVAADGTNVWLNNDPAAGQIIPHTHFHIIPRHKRDGLKLWPQKPYPEGEMDKVANKIRSVIL